MEPLSFQEYICSLDLASLPRVLKICSGVYFQGSVYEIGGTECCLSTGDLVKIIGFCLKKVTCQDLETGQETELPLNFNGYFQPSQNKVPYKNLKALAKNRPAEPYSFTSAVDLTMDGQLIPKEQPIFLLSVAKHQDQEFASCSTMGQNGQQLFHVPLSMEGQFYKCGEKQQQYTLSQVLKSEALRGQHLKCSAFGKHSLLLCPVYEVQAIMHMRKEVVKIPSTLEVDVEDVTEMSQHIHFIKPLMLSDVLGLEGPFPMQAEILEGPEHPPIFENWISCLQKQQRIQIHGKSSAWRILASSTKSKRGFRHFLISSDYEGRFRRRPREFTTAFELAERLGAEKGLHVVVTKDCESTEENLPSLCVGDRLEVLHLAQTQVYRQEEHKSIDVLLCNRSNGEDEESDQVMVPLHLEGSFVEEVSDSRKFSLPEIMEQLELPCEVKVAIKDPSLASDILGSFSSLRLEAQITEPFLVISLCEEPSESFQIPPQWLDMSLFFTEEPAPQQTPQTDRSKVEELTESFYYHLLKLMPSNTAPPPRPPKRRDVCDTAGNHPSAPRKPELPLRPVTHNKCLPMESLAPPSKPRNLQGPSIVQSIPNEYSLSCPGSQKTPKPPKHFREAPATNVTDDSDHDYELVDEDLKKTIHKMREAVLHY